MWQGVIEELQQEGCLGPAFPVACHQHPDVVEYISEPGKLAQIAPDGGLFDNRTFCLLKDA